VAADRGLEILVQGDAWAENTKLDFREKEGFSACHRSQLDVFSDSKSSAAVKNVWCSTSVAPDAFVVWC